MIPYIKRISFSSSLALKAPMAYQKDVIRKELCSCEEFRSKTLQTPSEKPSNSEKEMS